MTKYVNNNGVSEMWLNIKNWVTSQLLGYSQTGHTHSADDVSNVVTTNTTQNISSQKTITNNYHFDRGTNLFTLGVLPASNSTLNPTWFLDNNGSYFAWHQLQATTDGTLRQVFQLRNKFLNGTVSNAEGSSFLSTGLEYGFNSNGKQYFAFGGSLNCNLIPLGNQTKNIGSSSYKWNNLYVKNGYVTNLYINNTQFLPSDYAQVGHTHVKSEITDFPTLSTVATSGSYNDLTDLPTIPSPYTPPTFTYDSSTETLTVSNTIATVFNYDSNTETLEIQVNG